MLTKMWPSDRRGKRKPKQHTNCLKCGDLIPYSRRSDAKFCSQSCRAAAEKKRYKDRNPEYVARQNALVRRLRHLKEYGHTNFIERPDLNPRDRFALARSLGFRSMLEYNVAKQLTDAGVPFEYEKLKIKYTKPVGEFLEDDDTL